MAPVHKSETKRAYLDIIIIRIDDYTYMAIYSTVAEKYSTVLLVLFRT